MCARDPLFWFNSMCWVFEPRNPRFRTLPFVTFEVQDEAVDLLVRAISASNGDVGAEKSRGEGGTIIVLYVFDWFARFQERCSFMCASRNQEMVDKSGDDDSLFAKLDFLDDHLPKWIRQMRRPNIERQSLMIRYPDTNSQIIGRATTDDLGRGGRRKAVFGDEAASLPNLAGVNKALSEVTNVRIWVSTPKGRNEFFALRNGLAKKRRLLTMHWTRNPLHARGLTFEGSNDPATLEEWRKRVMEGGAPLTPEDIRLMRPTSPWHRSRCEQLQSRVFAAQEYDLDYDTIDFPAFRAETIDAVLRAAKPPVWVGDIVNCGKGQRPELHEREGGPLRVWLPFGPFGLMRESDRCEEHVIGVDIAAGTSESGSFSCACGGRKREGMKVFEYATSGVEPRPFCDIVVSLGRIFTGGPGYDAIVGYEAQGVGQVFGKQLVERSYGAVHYRDRENRYGPRSTEDMGWWSSVSAKVTLLSEYQTDLKEGRVLNYSRWALQEMRNWFASRRGGELRFYHSGAELNPSPFAAGESHGDVVIADALMAMLLRRYPAAALVAESALPVYGSREWRLALHREKRVAASGRW